MTVVNVMVKMSPSMKAHAAKYAEDEGITLSELTRIAVAQFTKYDMNADLEMEVWGRPRKYASEEARKEAARKRYAERVERDKLVIAAVMKRERLESVAALERWLEERGIDIAS